MKHGNWLSRMERESRCRWALSYLTRHHVRLVKHDTYGRSELSTDKEKLVATLGELERSGDFERIRLLKEAVRQERAAELRAKERRAIKRLDLGYSARLQLAQQARAARQTQARYIEDMIETENRLRKTESQTLKNERAKLKSMAIMLDERRDKLDKHQRTLELREEALRKLNSLVEPLSSFVDQLLALDVHRDGTVEGELSLPEGYGLDHIRNVKACISDILSLEVGQVGAANGWGQSASFSVSR